MKYFFLSLFTFSIVLLNAQKEPVTGVFTYKASITFTDSISPFTSWGVVMRTNDTISRVETETDLLGTQVYIRHMSLNKAYLLLQMGTDKYAIQTDLSKKKDSIEVPPAYTAKKLRGKKKIHGIKCVRYEITYPKVKPFVCYFAKSIPNKFLEVYTTIPGLALDYYIPSEDGLIHYELQSFVAGPVNRDLFGVPSDYKRITFDEFMHAFYGE